MTPKQRSNLKRMLAPKHVAFIGGQDADIAATWCTKAGFDGQIFGVNPKRSEIGGHPCFSSVEALPEAPDAAFVAVPRAAIVQHNAFGQKWMFDRGKRLITRIDWLSQRRRHVAAKGGYAERNLGATYGRREETQSDKGNP